MSSKPQTPKGFRDFLPEQMAIRSKIVDVLREVFEKYGFAELQTPALEYADILLGKYGEDAEKLMYLFKDSGGRDVGLKYDLTVPLARVMASHLELPRPFKRYQIQPVWRAENTQRGRYREFYQCDVDIVGSRSPLSDAEILVVTFDALTSLGFTNFTININSRMVLFGLMELAKIPKELHLSVIRTIDKLDKKPQAEIKEELSSKGLSSGQIDDLFLAINKAVPDQYLQATIDAAKLYGVDDRLCFEPSLARGLDYYSGPIFESVISDSKIGSVSGGGRYDNLLKQIGGLDEPAVGTTIGLERIVEIVSAAEIQKDISLTPAKALITIFSPDMVNNSIELANSLRKACINIEVYPDTNTKIEKQLKYADLKEIPYAIIVGPEEINKNTITVKNLNERSQKELSFEQLLETLTDTR